MSKTRKMSLNKTFKNLLILSEVNLATLHRINKASVQTTHEINNPQQLHTQNDRTGERFFILYHVAIITYMELLPAETIKNLYCYSNTVQLSSLLPST